jgi:ATP/ADP translocase
MRQPVEPQYRNLVRTGYLCAGLFPIAGIVLGVIIATKPGRVARHGWAILAICTVIIALLTVAYVLQAQQQSYYYTYTYSTY